MRRVSQSVCFLLFTLGLAWTQTHTTTTLEDPQTITGNKTFTGNVTATGINTVDFSASGHTLPALKGTIAGKPATCTVGEVYFATNATAGQNWFFCTATNVWTQQLNAGGLVSSVFGRTGAIVAATNDYAFSQISGTATGAQLPTTAVQTNQDNTYTTGTQNFSAAGHTQPAVKGTIAGKPATCTVGEVYFATDATAGQNWFFCTSTNTWTQQLNSGAGGATIALSNLAAVAINTALLPSTAAGSDFGSATKPWKDLWMAGSSGTPATNNFRFTGTATAAQIVTFPDNSGTVAETNLAQTWTATPNFTAGAAGISVVQSKDVYLGDAIPVTGLQNQIFAIPQSAINCTLVNSVAMLGGQATAGSPTYNIDKCTANCTSGAPTWTDIYTTPVAIPLNATQAVGGTPNTVACVAGNIFKIKIPAVGTNEAQVSVSLQWVVDAKN